MNQNEFWAENYLVEKLKQNIAIVKFDVDNYKKEIKKYKKDRLPQQHYYDYDLSLDFSDDPTIPFDIDNRKYYYNSHHYLKLGLFQRKDVPVFKVSLSDLDAKVISELANLDDVDRNYILKQAVGRIFEDINFDLYHNGISNLLKVRFVE